MLVGITRPDRGSISWSARTTATGQLSPELAGYLPEDRGLYQDVTLESVLAYFGTLRGMTRADAMAASRLWLERLSLADRAKDRLGTLSKGNQQKVQFAAAVLHKPAFAILDEPFSGLDPLNQELFLGLVRGLRDDGTTVLFSAHQMALVERMADRIFVMQGGREVLYGTIEQIRERWGTGDTLVLQVSGTPNPGTLDQHPAVARIEVNAETVRITLRRGHHVGDLLGVCARTFVIESVRTEQPSLHDMYIATVGAPAPQEAA